MHGSLSFTTVTVPEALQYAGKGNNMMKSNVPNVCTTIPMEVQGHAQEIDTNSRCLKSIVIGMVDAYE